MLSEPRPRPCWLTSTMSPLSRNTSTQPRPSSHTHCDTMMARLPWKLPHRNYSGCLSSALLTYTLCQLLSTTCMDRLRPLTSRHCYCYFGYWCFPDTSWL
ncbi:hypothetical protein NP493_25g01010 [Ridgeia piscesae]|uniref:Uncharacterized protein n=1 Tax=Ridgeia piscesae TaxID=27915 RepID=A0AAD9UKA5_RIDPI|nr:hypothetical protein NP493_25g01010 [Ridgeia piscesae]